MTEQKSSKTVQTFSSLSDDVVLPFHTELAGVNGRVIRMGASIDSMLSAHEYPVPVSKLLGEAIALTALVGSALKFDGRLIMQTKSDGPVDMLVAQFMAPGALRGYARFDETALKDLSNGNEPDVGALLGTGHLVLTIDQGPDMDRYQGIVALEGGSLAEAAHNYFEQSEQLPSFVRLAVAQHFEAGDSGEGGRWTWRAGGLIIQDLTSEGGKEISLDLKDGEDIAEDADEDGWNRAQIIAQTVEDHELLDPMLSSEQLIYRLFHDERVRVFPGKPVEAKCQCSRDHIKRVLEQFSAEDKADMVKDGLIEVTCEFCSTQYSFAEDEI